MLWLVYPVVKALHELGHAYATKKWGGEVHEIGIMLLVLTPVPYVDASASWGFRDKGKRMVVGSPTKPRRDRKSTRLNSSHSQISYAVFCLKKKIQLHLPHETPQAHTSSSTI